MEKTCKWCGDLLTKNNRAKPKQINGSNENVSMCINCDSRSFFRTHLEKCLISGSMARRDKKDKNDKARWDLWDGEEMPRILEYLSNSKRIERWKSIRAENESNFQINEIAQLPLMPIESADMELFNQFKAFMAMMKNNGSK
jgi:hypothetical protein